ncbi:MAG: alpha-2-macroglobulin, partial [Dehalococcoidia bacterium]|nr:alpha-2-macroglobulin [Dehalococcoidia bacterium]
EVTATSGEVKTTVTEAVQLPANIDRELGDLTIKMEPSLASGMQSGLKYLDEFPYQCVEQTISRFLPNIITLRALDKVGIDNAELRNKLPNLVSSGIQRLYGAQNPDGSWGWWPGEPGDTYITAYALFGLTVAQREGFAVQTQVIGKAAAYLSSYLANNRDVYSPEGPNLRAYILYVLAEAGKGENGTTVALYERRDSLGRYGRAYLAMALFDLNKGLTDSRVKSLIEDINSSAVASATGVHWEEASSDRNLMGTNNRTTSVVLDALVRTDPGNLLIPGAVRWLMVSRGEGHWETTQETAMAIIGLTDYLAMSGELNPDYSYELTLNGKLIGGDKVTRANVNAQNTLSIDVPSLLNAETNTIRMTRFPSPGEQTMAGKLYYSLYLRY